MFDEKTTTALRRELGIDGFVQLTDTFFRDFSERLARLQQQVANENRENLEFEAYSILGAAASLGLTQLAAEASTVARWAHDAEWEAIKAGLSRLRRAGVVSIAELTGEYGDVIAGDVVAPFPWDDVY